MLRRNRARFSDVGGAIAFAPFAQGGATGLTIKRSTISDNEAVDGPASKCLATDQRGVVRPQGTACDIGAFELKQ